MENLVCLTKLLFDGKTDNIHAIESFFGTVCQMTSRLSVENKNCNQGLQENTYSSKITTT